jgi:hypothetical protein
MRSSVVVFVRPFADDVELIAIVFIGLSSADAVGLPDDWAVRCLPPDLGQSEVWSVEERLSLDRMKLSRIATRDDDDTRLQQIGSKLLVHHARLIHQDH